VLSAALAMVGKELAQLVIERALQNLVQTATGDDLDRIGAEPQIDTPRKLAQAAVMVATIDSTETIPALTAFVGDSAKYIYRTAAEVEPVDDVATLSLVSDLAGADYTLAVDDTLSIQQPLDGCASTATVTDVTTEGVDSEGDTAYRRRIMTEMRTQGGGGNSADYRTWAEAVEGVERAFPYADDDPGDVVVYIECDADLDPDGIPSGDLLTTVKEEILTDPDTGIARPPLGILDENITVSAISRTTVDIEIRGLAVEATVEEQVKEENAAAVDEYLRAIVPFIDRLDSPYSNNSLLTDLTLSQVIQEVLTPYGGTAEGIGISTDELATFIASYQVGAGEMLKLGDITYV
jgi:uncharacterized phage protein gp47/JayE